MDPQQKASPVSSILLFVGALFCVFALFSASWFGEHGSGIGPVRYSFCYDGDCKGGLIFKEMKHGMGTELGLAILTDLGLLASVILGIIAGVAQLKPAKSGISMGAMICGAVAGVFGLAFALKMKDLGGGFSYGIFLFLLGVGGVIGGAIMGMMRPASPMMMGAYPGYPMGGPNMGWPGQAPMQQQPMMPSGQVPMQQPMMQQQPPQMSAPRMQAQTAPCTTCGTPTTYVAQYQRYFCQRCNKYL